MLDRNNDGRSQFGMDDDFHDDLGEFNPSKTAADPLNSSFDDADNFSLEDDPNDPNNPNRSANLNPPPKSGLMETIKTYGVVVLVVLVVGYFGIKYSFKAITSQNNANQVATVEPDVNAVTTPIPAVTLDNTVVPTTVTTTSALPDAIVPVQTFDPLTTVTNVQAQTSEQTLPLPGTVTPPNTVPSANANAMASSEMKQDIENLKKMLDDLTLQLTSNRDLSDNSLKDIKQQVQQLVIYMQGVGKGVSILSSELTQQQKVLEGMLAGVPMPKTASNQSNQSNQANQSSGTIINVDKSATANSNNIVVEAVISGRAWIKTSNTGTTLSVGIGDMIPGYGKIIDINPVKATITTDTGSELSLQK